MKVLIVDDNPTSLKLICAQLEAENHLVAQARDGEEALALLEHQPMDVVISDILMPRMDGYRLCHEIRKSKRLCRLPTIIYSSTYTSPSDVMLALDVGADKYLKKPSSIQAIVAALYEVVARPQPMMSRAGALPEVEVLKEYSKRLVDRLEEKHLALERTNAELNATRDQLAHLLEHSPAVIYSLKVEGEQVVPHLVSENMTRLLGFTVQEASTFDWWVAHLHPEDRERAMASIPETLRCGLSNTEYRIRHKSGHYLWVEDNQRLVRDANGWPTNIVGVWTNITERKQAQSQLQRKHRLESIGDLACGVAHDINNALGPIMVAAELLRLDAPALACGYLDIIEAGARRGADMVKQLLTFAKGAEGARLPVQPQLLLKELEHLIKVSFPKTIELRIRCAGDLRAVMGDATQLLQVLLNLCVNARDAMPDGGTLTLKAENIEMDTASASMIADARPGTYVAWSVTDTGVGIPPEILERIFEPFFTTKGPANGTGLGLSTVIGIIKSHGGFLQVSSKPGQGSTFTVFVPAAATGEGEASPTIPSGMTFHGNGETVLVVDDEAPVRNTIRAILTRLNFKVLTASDGLDALVQVAEKQTELRAVITDFRMPNMNGLDFVRVLKARLPEAGIIVVSGGMVEEAAAEFHKLGISMLLEKPFSQESLVEALKKVFQK